MSPKRRILFGALGALAPIIVSLVVVDFEAVANDATFIKWAGYAIRVSALAGLGGLVAYFQKTEISDFKVFQIGMAWPAFFTAGSVGIQSGAQYQELARVQMEVDSAYVAQMIPAEQTDSLQAVITPEHLNHLFEELIEPVPDSTLWSQLRRGLSASTRPGGLRPQGIP